MIPEVEVDSFAFVIHPIDPRRDVARQYPLLARILPTPLIHFFSRFWPPVYISHITGVRSEATGKVVEGDLVACPFTIRRMLQLPPQKVYDKVVQTGRLAQSRGARILGLGAFVSVVGDGGVTVSQRLNMPVTTGHSLTVAMAVEVLKKGASERGIWLELATAAVVGATGNIGLACVKSLAPLVGRLILVGRQDIRLAQARPQAEAAGAQHVRTSMNVNDVSEADLVLSATSAVEPLIYPRHLKRGAVVCDVALPPDISPSVKRERDDVLVVEGGVVDVPGEVDFGFDFGLPPGKAYACMAEVMILALEGRYENYSLGKEIQTDQVHEIAQLARKHGFRVAL